MNNFRYKRGFLVSPQDRTLSLRIISRHKHDDERTAVETGDKEEGER